MTTLEQAKQMADGYKVVPISREILSDTHPKRRDQTLLHVRKRRKSGSMGKIHIFGI